MQLAGAASRLRDTLGSPRFDEGWLDRGVSLARQALTIEQAEQAFAKGRDMTLEHAIEYALSDGQESGVR